jgi:protein required for attachment to host cells
MAMRQEKTWIVTFDEAACRVFSFNGVPRRLQELPDERRTGAHKPSFSDRPGRVHARMGERRSSVAPRTDPERRLETQFVEALAVELEAKGKTGAFDRLIIAASPRALGAFRAAASAPLLAKVVREIHGDYVNGEAARLFEAIDQ